MSDSCDASVKIAELVLELDKVKTHNETLRKHNQRLVQIVNDLKNPKSLERPTVAASLETSKVSFV